MIYHVNDKFDRIVLGNIPTISIAKEKESLSYPTVPTTLFFDALFHMSEAEQEHNFIKFRFSLKKGIKLFQLRYHISP
jgi:hypothetical protein